ncbi:MAG: hypothetical protein ABS62_08410 [Microbacterium sp. SCN 70-200]|nr:MAG: hypothetical protein ABS62_08410 [Microbacterium sp. SCN 70-200]OJV83847.1 MAG: hypothetical protein BGO46_12710 [Microbacterium sp. 70-16]
MHPQSGIARQHEHERSAHITARRESHRAHSLLGGRRVQHVGHDVMPFVDFDVVVADEIVDERCRDRMQRSEAFRVVVH